ncbi:MAG: elongation factor G [Ruminococcaceae bacterium]|nr:elongation factor G [Oscillospiraceae bacterium]
MKSYAKENIRNVTIAGHGARGKTTLAEAMLYIAGASDRLGRVADGNTVLDFDAEEKKRNVSISSAMACIEWRDRKVNIIDTPGLFDFEGARSEGIRAAETAVIVLSCGHNVDVGAEKTLRIAGRKGLSKFIAVSKCDGENRDFYKTLGDLQDKYGTAICPVVVPYMVDGVVDCYVNFLQNKAFKYDGIKATEVAIPQDAHIEEIYNAFVEAVASADEDLMMKFFDGEEFTHDEKVAGLSQGVADGTVIPVYACSGFTGEAVDLLLNGITKLAPAPKGEGDIACDANGPLAAICFKTVADPFVGKMSFFKVVSGKITPATKAYNARTEEEEKMGKIVFVKGAKQEDAAEIVAGDIGVVTKLSGFKTGDTMCDAKNPVELAPVDFPAPCYSMAVNVVKKGEEDKVASGLNKLQEEDGSMKFYTNKETKEQIVSGLGEQHLESIVSKLKNKYGVEVTLTAPRVAYRETIRKTVDKQGRHKKQSGGHGQFGDVWIRFEPYMGEEEFVFNSDEVVGGAVPKNFFPAVEKGLRECVASGLIAGYPMVGIKACLHDGSYHPVDSSEMAFKMAARIAFKAAVPEAAPTILEPIGTLKAYIPDKDLGDIMGDVNKRRGRVLGMGPAEETGTQELIAEVPMAEMSDFAITLRSVTAGRGSFTLEFARYEDAPNNIAEKVIAEAKLADDDE